MLEIGKVSIVTPCYNGSSYVERFFHSVIAQKYTPIQLIIIDDGSTDNTLEILKKWDARFKQEGIEYIWLTQPNGGAASAINKGLPYANGEFFIWPDSDDELMTNSIQNRVDYLNQNKDVNIVRSKAIVVHDNQQKTFAFNIGDNQIDKKEDIFEDMVLQRTYISSGCYMVRMKLVDEILNRKIMESHAGQNIQILLPIVQNNEVAHLDKNLYRIYIRQDSHSRNIVSNIYQESVKREIDLATNLSIIVTSLNREDLVSPIYQLIYSRCLLLSSKYNKVDEVKKYAKKLKASTFLNKRILFFSTLAFLQVLPLVNGLIKRIKKK